jgi:hypothetical protein
MNSSNSTYNRDYGILTEGSKSLNKLFGDYSGKTVSIRTARGFKKAFRLKNMSDETAEDIVHGGMIITAGLLSSRNQGAKVAGLLLALGLFTAYQNG